MGKQSGEYDPSRKEIDLDDYPERVGCNILPQVHMHYVVTEVEVTNAEGQQVIFEVPDEAVTSFGVHHIYHGLPEGLRQPFADQLAAGMVACRIAERFDDESLVRIELPTKSEENSALVSAEQLARRV